MRGGALGQVGRDERAKKSSSGCRLSWRWSRATAMVETGQLTTDRHRRHKKAIKKAYGGWALR